MHCNSIPTIYFWFLSTFYLSIAHFPYIGNFPLVSLFVYNRQFRPFHAYLTHSITFSFFSFVINPLPSLHHCSYSLYHSNSVVHYYAILLSSFFYRSLFRTPNKWIQMVDRQKLLLWVVKVKVWSSYNGEISGDFYTLEVRWDNEIREEYWYAVRTLNGQKRIMKGKEDVMHLLLLLLLLYYSYFTMLHSISYQVDSSPLLLSNAISCSIDKDDFEGESNSIQSRILNVEVGIIP